MSTVFLSMVSYAESKSDSKLEDKPSSNKQAESTAEAQPEKIKSKSTDPVKKDLKDIRPKFGLTFDDISKLPLDQMKAQMRDALYKYGTEYELNYLKWVDAVPSTLPLDKLKFKYFIDQILIKISTPDLMNPDYILPLINDRLDYVFTNFYLNHQMAKLRERIDKFEDTTIALEKKYDEAAVNLKKIYNSDVIKLAEPSLSQKILNAFSNPAIIFLLILQVLAFLFTRNR